jgi:hypothetical protein
VSTLPDVGSIGPGLTGVDSRPGRNGESAMQSTDRAARVAGFLYLLVVVTGLFTLIYVPRTVIVHGNATATAGNLLAHETLFRFGIVVGLISTLIFMFLALALYRLLKEVNQQHAAVMTILVLVQVPLAILTAMNQLAVLVLARGAEFLSVFDKPQRDALAMLFLNIEAQGTFATEILWGLWLFPLGLLVFRSRFLPRFLGIWLIVNGFAYLAMSFTGLLMPQYEKMVSNIAFPALLGELVFMLWLLIMGARPRPLADSVTPSTGG